MAVAADLILSAALEYASYGWRVVPLYYVKEGGACSCKSGSSCTSPGKHPCVDNWQVQATCDEDQINEWFERWPEANVGFALGKASGVIDFEFDSPKQQQTFVELFDNKHPVTACYESYRGSHFLFEWRDDLPGGATFKLDELVLRLGNNEMGTMSVLPPSMHPSGKRYRWLLSPAECLPIPLPDEIATRIWNWDGAIQGGQAKSQDYWKDLAKGVGAGQRNESAAQFIGRILCDLKNPFDANAVERVFELFLAWNERNTTTERGKKGPLDREELARTFASILKRHRQQVLSDQGRHNLNGEHSWEPKQDEVVPAWRVIIVESRPRSIRLYSPLWSMKAPRGYIELTTRQYLSWGAIREQSLEQADVYVTGKMQKEWEGGANTESLARKLIEAADYLPAPLESKRNEVIADRLLELLDKAQPLRDDAIPSGGRPFIGNDGAVYFKFTPIFEDMAFSQDRIKRTELSSLLDEIGATDEVIGAKEKRQRLKKLTRSQVRKLRGMGGVEQE